MTEDQLTGNHWGIEFYLEARTSLSGKVTWLVSANFNWQSSDGIKHCGVTGSLDTALEMAKQAIEDYVMTVDEAQ